MSAQLTGEQLKLQTQELSTLTHANEEILKKNDELNTKVSKLENEVTQSSDIKNALESNAVNGAAPNKSPTAKIHIIRYLPASLTENFLDRQLNEAELDLTLRKGQARMRVTTPNRAEERQNEIKNVALQTEQQLIQNAGSKMDLERQLAQLEDQLRIQQQALTLEKQRLLLDSAMPMRQKTALLQQAILRTSQLGRQVEAMRGAVRNYDALQSFPR